MKTFQLGLDNGYFTTTNRKLEQFFYMHKIHFENQFKTEDGLTAWVYRDTSMLQSILKEYKEIYGGGR